MSQSVASVDAGRYASALGRWRDAYAAYSGADENNFTAEDLESFAEAAWWTCRMEEALDLRQRAYAAFMHTGGAFVTDGDFTDYGGQGVHMAARIGATAGAREILVSSDTIDGFSSAFHVSEARDAELKGLEHPVPVVSVNWR